MGGSSSKEEIIARLDALDQEEIEINKQLRDLQIELNGIVPVKDRVKVKSEYFDNVALENNNVEKKIEAEDNEKNLDEKKEKVEDKNNENSDEDEEQQQPKKKKKKQDNNEKERKNSKKKKKNKKKKK